MDITTDMQDGVAVLVCRGSLDANSIPHFKKSMEALIKTGTAHRVVLDATDLTFIDSMGLGVLISYMRKFQEADGEIKVAALTSDVQSIFEITRLNRLFDICKTTADACARFETSPS
jgi:anti-sigma B factor antagonist